VNVYILDTGIRKTHAQFGVRANYIANGLGGNFVGDANPDAADCHGHGTHVAGSPPGRASAWPRTRASAPAAWSTARAAAPRRW
jgi:hypothetical protein